MENQGTEITAAGQASITTATATFDPSILAGNVSEHTARQYTRDFERYLDFAGSQAQALQPTTLALYRQHLFETGYTLADGTRKDYSVAAINRRLSAIKRIMQEAATQGYVDHATADAFTHVRGLSLKHNKERQRAHARTGITRAQMRQMLDQVNTDTAAGMMHYALLMLLSSAGLRITEAVTLRQEQIQWYEADGKAGWVAMIMGKNETEPSPVSIGYRAKEAIDAWLAFRRDGLFIDVPWVFTGFGGRGDRDPSEKPIWASSAWRLVKRYAELAGIENVKPHDLRRFVGTRLAKKDIRLAQKQLRHKTIETTARHYVIDEIDPTLADTVWGDD